MLFTALRLSEAVALDLEDLQVTARKGRIVVRSGKGDLQREVPLNPLVRQVLDEWLGERTAIATPGEQAMFSRARARASRYARQTRSYARSQAWQASSSRRTCCATPA
jgi:site-specific recombinase XerC